MVKTIFWIIVFCFVGFFVYRYLKPKVEDRAMLNGDIVSNDLMSPEQKARFLKENAGEDSEGQSEHKSTHGNISADGPGPATVATTPVGSAPAAAASTAGTTATPAAGSAVYPAPEYATPAAAPVTSASMDAPPAADSIAPNPPNGMVFAGRGTFQWYRQGNITWRVDTVTGRSCIVFATDEEWRKPRVLSHGCGGSA